MYGKLVNGNVVEAPKVIKKEGRIIFNPSKEFLKEMGYKEVIFGESGADTHWKEEEDRIIQEVEV